MSSRNSILPPHPTVQPDNTAMTDRELDIVEKRERAQERASERRRRGRLLHSALTEDRKDQLAAHELFEAATSRMDGDCKLLFLGNHPAIGEIRGVAVESTISLSPEHHVLNTAGEWEPVDFRRIITRMAEQGLIAEDHAVYRYAQRIFHDIPKPQEPSTFAARVAQECGFASTEDALRIIKVVRLTLTELGLTEEE